MWPLFFVLEMSAAYIQVHSRLNFFMEANNMNLDQTAKLSSGASGLQFEPDLHLHTYFVCARSEVSGETALITGSPEPSLLMF